MNMMELKYGCNPNQKPRPFQWKTDRIFPLLFLMESRDISIFWMLLTAGSWLKNLKKQQAFPQQLLLNM